MVELESDIPDQSPIKDAVEASIHGVFDELAGRWSVRIRRARPWTQWWGFVEIDGPKGFRRFFVVERPEQISEQTSADRELLRAVARLEARWSVDVDAPRRAPRTVSVAVARPIRGE